ncbi:LacI family DNA-binding transcriptional regulator [Ruminococcus sp. SR1/5]|uniref:LacI family DNA-binding transcriptional regulator n=1 Tax=Ruminococcus sp. SR1/5 TaxID=657323 RepID=UPI0002D95C61|nr:LacI family DNA-binding transcriptional regulator [Ruminococcus sp. SR1/5]
MATIKEIAQRAGVSTTTVSNVIHGKTKKYLLPIFRRSRILSGKWDMSRKWD